MVSMDGTAAMMKFRTAYLRAIQRAWRIDGYLESLIKDPETELNSLGFYSPWNIDIEIGIPDKAHQSHWMPTEAAGWVGPNAVVSIWLPPPPPVEDQGQAWACYYDMFPTFMGTERSNIKQQESSNQSSPPEIGEALQLGMGQWQQFLEFGGVMMRLIAMAWTCDELRAEMGKALDPASDIPIIDGIPILQRWLGYNVPWNMDIKFKLTGWYDYGLDVRWHPDSDPNEEGWIIKTQGYEDAKWPSSKDWPGSCRNSLHFYVPPVPDQDDWSIDAIALSAYNVTGDQYPFTCP